MYAVSDWSEVYLPPYFGESSSISPSLLPYSSEKQRQLDCATFDSPRPSQLMPTSSPLFTHSSILLIHSHPPSLTLSFQSVTLLSAPLTASTFPDKLQLTLQTKHSNVNVLHVQLPSAAVESLLVHILTVRSCDADAM